MKINKTVLKNFSPCTERWKNFLSHYSEFDGSYDEFLDLEHISYEDKIWVSRRVLNRNQLVHAAILCAESTLFIFEKKFPDDKRIHDCLSFMKTIVDFRSMTNEQRERLMELRKGVWSSRAAADADAAYAAAYAAAAADAAAAAAAAAADAAYAAADAAYAAAAAAAAAYAADAGNLMSRDEARKAQQKINLEFFKMAAAL